MDSNQVGAGNVQANNNTVGPDALGLGQTLGKAVNTFAELTDLLLRPMATHLGGLGGDFFAHWRRENLWKFKVGWESKCKAAGVDPAAVPPSILLPALDAVKDVDDPDLQEMWQQLMANAAAEPARRKILYVETLKQFSAGDGKVFDQFVRTGIIAFGPDLPHDDIEPSFARLEAVRLVTPLYQGSVVPPSGRTRTIVEIRDVRGREHRTVLEPVVSGQVQPDHVRIGRAAWQVTPFGLQFHAAVTLWRADQATDAPPPSAE